MNYFSEKDNLSSVVCDTFVDDREPRKGLAIYFDINRMMNLEEKFESEEAVDILRNAIAELIQT